MNHTLAFHVLVKLFHHRMYTIILARLLSRQALAYATEKAKIRTDINNLEYLRDIVAIAFGAKMMDYCI